MKIPHNPGPDIAEITKTYRSAVRVAAAALPMQARFFYISGQHDICAILSNLLQPARKP